MEYSEQRKYLCGLLASVAALTSIGIIFIYSSSSFYAHERMGSELLYVKKHLTFLLPSLVGFFFFALVPTVYWKRYAGRLFLLSVIITSLTLFSPWRVVIHGSRRWLKIAGLSFQPSEMLKLFVFMYLGVLLEDKQKHVVPVLASYLGFLGMLLPAGAVLLKQPDFGSVVTIFTTSLLLFFVAHVHLKHLGILALCAAPVGLLLVITRAYRLRRILIFLDPWKDPGGRGFQIIQSLIAIGTGGMWGRGIGCSRQKYLYLPMQHTDFIFPIIAEETGFIGSCIVLLLYLGFAYCGLKVVSGMRDAFSFYTSLGYIVMISLQAVINIMVTCSLLPTKGFGLPFISFGGSCLLSMFCMVGLVVGSVRAER